MGILGGLGVLLLFISCNLIEKLFIWPYGENFHRAFFVLELGGEEWAGGSPERFKGGLKGFYWGRCGIVGIMGERGSRGF